MNSEKAEEATEKRGEGMGPARGITGWAYRRQPFGRVGAGTRSLLTKRKRSDGLTIRMEQKIVSRISAKIEDPQMNPQNVAK